MNTTIKTSIIVVLTLISSFKLAAAGSNRILYLEDYGAVYNDTIDDTQALKDALVQAGITKNVVISFSEGQLIISDKIDIPDVDVTFVGRGMDISVLNWTAKGGFNNLRADNKDPNGKIEFRDLTITTSVPNDTGIMLHAKNSTLISTVIQNVKISGTEGGYWHSCFVGDLLPITQFTNCTIEGDLNNTQYLVSISGFTNGSRFLNNTLSGGKIGFSFVGSLEGTFLINNNISNVETGIIRRLESTSGGSEPLFNVQYNNIRARTKCLDLRGISSSNIAENILTIENPANEANAYGIYVAGANLERSITFTENKIINAGSPNNTYAFYTSGFDQGLIFANNVLVNFKTGIHVSSSSEILVGDNFSFSTIGEGIVPYDFKTNVDLFLKESRVRTILPCNGDCSPAPIKSVKASGFVDANTLPTNAVDCDLESSWDCEDSSGFITLELFKEELIDTIEILFNSKNGYIYNFEIQTSINDTSYESKGNFSSSGDTSSYDLFTFSGSEAKFVKIIAKGNNVNNNNSFKDIKINCTTISQQGTGTSSIRNISIKAGSLVVYPNPVDGNILNISFLSQLKQTVVSVYRMDGVQVFEQKFNTNINEIMTKELDLSALSTGIYILRINNEIQKIIKS